MPNTTASFFQEWGSTRRNYHRDDAPNHNRRWTTEEENLVLFAFAAGESVAHIAEVRGRTRGAINGRLSQLLGIRWPETPERFRAAGRPIRRQRTRTMPHTTFPPPGSILPDLRAVAFNELIPAQTFELSNARPYTHRHHVDYVRPPRQSAAPAVETPPHLEPAVALNKKHFVALAAQIKAARPGQEGRTAAAQHSTLNKLAYKLATLFEGENSSFDRTRWLDACGVTTNPKE